MTNAAVVFTKPEDPVKVFMSAGPLGVKYLLTNTPESWLDLPPEQVTNEIMARAQGRGFTPDRGLILYPFYQSALDLWSLNRARLMQLEDHGVTNARAAELHEESTRALRAAREALENRRYDAFAARSREAWGYEARAYPDVRYAADDTVDGIVFYFMLLIPFCFFLERLFFGFTDIRKQLLAVGVIFAAVFMLLQNVHPAFQLSLTPYMVFLAFIILALALIIITMIVSRFDTEMKNLTRPETGLHEADIGRLSATAVAISLGISNLRKRKMRTALTAVTLTLLTFTVLSFTSFKTGIQFYTLDRENTPSYNGVLMRNLSWHALPTSFLPYVENAFREHATIVPPFVVRARRSEQPVHRPAGTGQGNGHHRAIYPGTACRRAVHHRPGSLSVAGRQMVQPGRKGRLPVAHGARRATQCDGGRRRYDGCRDPRWRIHRDRTARFRPDRCIPGRGR